MNGNLEIDNYVWNQVLRLCYSDKCKNTPKIIGKEVLEKIYCDSERSFGQNINSNEEPDTKLSHEQKQTWKPYVSW